eukprot:TRINITY_DN627_c0_g1_i1.p1 TRINITY_DN627_c0_g1~~TRINITY_DN627_c0_g1_i1.p1  ORF type:complete len:347 (-),score=65.76 TRINITY_DN627_c0_g1_i1:54-965(-)
MSSPRGIGRLPDDKILSEPYNYLLEIPGKGVRSQLIQAFNRWLKIDDQRQTAITEIVNMLHTASLLIDDIEDNSKLRRGIPVAHSIFGVPATINCANLQYFVALQKCHELLKSSSSQATFIFIDELINLHKGQGFDIYWRDNNRCPTEQEYKVMVAQKTGGLFRLAVRLMQEFSENKSDFIPLVDYLGLLFQIRDDYINLRSEEYMENKSFCEDLTEGKFSFPIIHSILSTPSDTRLLKILKQKTESVELKKYALSIMDKSGSFDYTKKVVIEYAEKVNEAILQLGGNRELEMIVQHLMKEFS